MKKDKISSEQQGENALLMPEVNREGQSIFKYTVKSDLELDGLQQQKPTSSAIPHLRTEN